MSKGKGAADEDGSEYQDAYTSLSKNKSSLAQESVAFNDKTINEKKCVELLNKIIFLLNQGEEFAEQEKTSMFFNVTKLFQCNHNALRRLIYVFIKELNANENEVFVVISCLMKDVHQNEQPIYKANALRVLSKIIDDQYV